VEELLDKGADANMQGEYSVSPIHCAANAGQLDCMKMLLELGAQLNICDDDNQTPLHYVHTHYHSTWTFSNSPPDRSYALCCK
jgi:ankyrin repeat protein